MEIAIAPAFADAEIPVRLGCIEAEVAPTADDAALGEILAEAATRRAEALGETPPAQVPAIAATRRAYKTLGKDPARYRPSAEALLRRVKQGKGLYRINSVVDINNLVSLETGISIGAYDADRLRPPVLFRPGAAGETYEGIGRGPINLEGLPLFADGDGPFGNPTGDSARTAVTGATRRLLMVLIVFDRAETDLDAALDRARELLRRHAGATAIETRVLDNAGAA